MNFFGFGVAAILTLLKNLNFHKVQKKSENVQFGNIIYHGNHTLPLTDYGYENGHEMNCILPKLIFDLLSRFQIVKIVKIVRSLVSTFLAV
jgi:hypothetical protein